MTPPALLALTLANIEVTGPLRCPTASDIKARLVELLSPSQQRVNHLMLVDAAEGQLYLWAYDMADGTLLSQRNLPATGSCALQALELASVAATWEAAFQRPAVEFHPAVPLPVPASAEGKAPHHPLRSVERVSLELGDSSGRSGTVPPPQPWDWTFGAGGGLSVSDGAALALQLIIGTHPRRSHFGIEAMVLLSTEHSTAFGSGAIGWTIPALAVGPTVRLQTSSIWLEGEVAALVGLSVARGSHFATNDTVLQPTGGAALGARVGLARGAGKHLEPWLGAWSIFWLQRESFVIPSRPDSLTLPQWELALGMGASFFP